LPASQRGEPSESVAELRKCQAELVSAFKTLCIETPKRVRGDTNMVVQHARQAGWEKNKVIAEIKNMS
jgi:hypothetical protein